MLIHRGTSALSSFRLQKLQQDLVAADIPVARITAQFLHIAELAPGTSALSAEHQTVFEKLLTYGPR
ncbi:hypothetical protein, partial [Geminisphaera colitermitum]|uniref:hypothetical protein n=1 Tax=Geminisphaera colitermitum TaxID=1148786 RepID=UPI0005B826C7